MNESLGQGRRRAKVFGMPLEVGLTPDAKCLSPLWGFTNSSPKSWGSRLGLQSVAAPRLSGRGAATGICADSGLKSHFALQSPVPPRGGISQCEGMMVEERVQKIIARSGLCSRRDADRMIAEGRVTVDGRVAVVGEKVDPSAVHLKVDGKKVKAPEPLRYLLVNKPREVMTTCDDPEERRTVIDIVRPRIRERVYPVGRLDYHSEGLIILTNDGELAARIAHPRHGIVREYLVKIRGDLSEAEHRKLMAGTKIDGVRVRPISARCESKRRGGSTSWWRVEVSEGRTHEVRELFRNAGHLAQRLRRTAIGPLRDKSLRAGEFRTLSEKEIKALRRAGSKASGPARQRGPRSGRAGGNERAKRRPQAAARSRKRR